MIPHNFKNEHFIDTINEIKNSGVPQRRQSYKYDLIFEEAKYPPKYVISLAYKHLTGEELAPK